MEKVKFIKSSKGKPMATLNGFIYQFCKPGNEKFIWRCVKSHSSKSLRCPGRLHTSESFQDGTVLNQLGVHNHEPSPVEREVKEVVGKIKDAAIVSSEVPSRIIAEGVKLMSSAATSSLPRIDSLKRGIRRVRDREAGSLKLPSCREEISLPPEFKV
jgi:FLYWCH zinc finger domain